MQTKTPALVGRAGAMVRRRLPAAVAVPSVVAKATIAPPPTAAPKSSVDPLALIDDYLTRLRDTIDRLDRAQLACVVQLFAAARDAGRTIFTMGNGGSGSTASHLVCDLNKGASIDRDRRFRVICLNDNLASLMAVANDIDYESIFVEPLKNFLAPGDLVVAISGSGNSPNVLRAVEWANTHGGVTLAFTGYDGGKLGRIAEHHLNIPVHDMQVAEDLHLAVGHILLRALSQPLAA